MTGSAGLRIAVLCGLALSALPAGAEPRPPAARPVVVELFTSQGCSSCPPADALFGELARRADVVALGFHVSYWDRLGWKDPWSSEAATERQKSYARRFTDGRIYTPQIVVDGDREMVGSDREAVLAAVHADRPPPAAPIGFAADRRLLTIGGGAGRGAVLLARFVRRRTTEVATGENAGRIARDANAVRALTTLGEWQGAARQFPIEAPAAGEGIAVLVQAADGQMLGAALLLGPE
jgi:hypothetical protein